MLSVCIPIFNFDVKPLVDPLLSGQQGLTSPYEIILIDDCSDEKFKMENRNLQGDNVKYIELPQNIGRSRTRNEFLKYASYNHLLFLDCDSVIISAQFLSAYMQETGKEIGVVCGGRVYSEERPATRYRLHWQYGKKVESKPAALRRQHPYRSFMTNNFMVDKSILQHIPFDSRIDGYGHEDTLFGYELKKQGIPIKHIENPVLHGQLQTNAEFLAKTETALENLCQILEFVNHDRAFIEDVALLRYYEKLKKIGCLFPLKLSYTICKPILRNLLLNGYSMPGIFSFYKLGFFALNTKS